MKNSSLLALVACLASVSAQAGSVGRAPLPNGAVRTAWAGALGDFFGRYDSESSQGYGFNSLNYLAEPTLEGGPRVDRFDAEQRIQLQRLAVELQAAGMDPDSFAKAESDSVRLRVLDAAAARAEEAANAEAEQILGQVPETGLTYASSARISERAATLWGADLLYIRPDLRRKLKGLVAEIERVQSEHEERIDAFLRELPRKIRAGAFAFDDILRREPDGWVLVDRSPVPFATLEEAVDSRLQELRSAAAGPWSLGMIAQLTGVLKKTWVQQALDGQGGIAKQTELVKRAEAVEAELETKVNAPPEPRLIRDLAEFKSYEKTGRLPSVGAIRRMIEGYDELFHHIPSFTVKWRIADWVSAKGEFKKGYPTWEALTEAKSLMIQRLHRRALQWMFGFFAALAGVVVAGILGPIPLGGLGVPLGWIVAAMLASVFTSLAIFSWFVLRRDMLKGGYTGEAAGRAVRDFLWATRPAD